uniref:Large ribosomal subunit protein bL28m n=2 Tax=Macrostomum lignano TaxID=282301 RepID=A0A1I8GI28_9PLAT
IFQATLELERAVFFYPHLRAALHRLPMHFRKRYMENKAFRRPAVHMKPFSEEHPDQPFVLHSDGRVYPSRHFDLPPQIFYPAESQRCLWANEGIVYGFRQRKKESPIHPRFWRPHLYRIPFHSELLNRWMYIIVSHRALTLIEQAGSLDQYILASSDGELNSRLGTHLKRDMLLALARLPPDSELRQRYAKYAVPLEEAEWIGLSLAEACKKQLKLESDAKKQAAAVPKKIELMRRLRESQNSAEAPVA